MKPQQRGGGDGIPRRLTADVHDDRAWADSSRTTAEVMLDLYRTMRLGAGDGVVIIGCNALSHLAAGIFELQRIGDGRFHKERGIGS